MLAVGSTSSVVWEDNFRPSHFVYNQTSKSGHYYWPGEVFLPTTKIFVQFITFFCVCLDLINSHNAPHFAGYIDVWRGEGSFGDVGYFADKVVKTNMDASVSGLAINQIINGLSAGRQDL